MSIGMTPEEYWHGEVDLPVYYRKADLMRRSQRNREMWMQGRYIFDAIVCAFSKEASQVYETGYLDEPYPITHEEAEKRRRRLEKAQYEKDLARMKAWTEAWNKKIDEGEVVLNG